MSGVAVIRYLLVNNAPLVALIPAGQIVAGDFPINQPMPAISVKQISSVPRLTISMLGPKMHTDRVQVSVLVKNAPQPVGVPAGYPGVKNVIKKVLAACPNQHGVINTFTVDSIVPDIEGPDLPNPELSLQGSSRDFIVKWFEP